MNTSRAAVAALVVLGLVWTGVGLTAPRNSAAEAKRARGARQEEKKPAEAPKAEESGKTADNAKAEESAAAAPPEQVAEDNKKEPKPAAAPAVVAGSKVGVVVMDEIERGYPALQAENDRLDAWRRDKKQYLDQLALYVFLTDEEFLDLVKFLDAEKPTDKDRQRYEALKEQNKQRDTEWRNLGGKATRTEAEEGRFAELRQLYENGEQRRQAKHEELNREFERRLNDAIEKLFQKVREYIAQVAQEQGLEVVLDSEYVLYGGSDITQAVIKKINAAEKGENAGAAGGK